ncbi:MAG: caspase family protein [Saprospiraceae bacterium]|nr:caspase family protein [Saprospiraceae bacterium]
MKYLLTLIALITTFCHPAGTCAQSIDNGTSTRAVIIGISDYQDPAIPDLRFADRDAEAFVDWLRSPAGGSLPDNQIKVLTNKNATTGKMIAALDGLIVASKPGDEAIIYFSGHGDVERVTKFQRGFLLTYDSPPAVYAAGAFSLQYLQDIVTTLSEAGVQAVVITDACRAGKLAGSEFGGSKATSAALAQQFANEVKILSCQPEEFSLEGEQWGGGRGAFSFNLVDALYGMADANADGTVNLLELGRYLEDKVTPEAAPHSQIPFTVGSKSAKIASVNTEALAPWRQQKNGGGVHFKKIDSRGLEDLTLAKADTGILEMYHAFTAALDAGNLMATDSTLGQSADDYYKRLVQEPSIADLHGLMTRNFAAALMDEGQQVINKFLKTDPATVDNIWANPIKYDHVPAHLHRAAELLGRSIMFIKTSKPKSVSFWRKRGKETTRFNVGFYILSQENLSSSRFIL